MDARLVKQLLRCVQSGDDRFPLTVSLESFLAGYGSKVGTRKGRTLYLDPVQKETIRALLTSNGIDPSTTPNAWDGMTRAESLSIGGFNEKFNNENVKRRRVSLKALRPSSPITIFQGAIVLPPSCHIDVDSDEVGNLFMHDWIVVVENWECFNNIHLAADRLEFPGDNPLVMWRGDRDSRSDWMLELLNRLQQPVAAFVDYDPSGLVIANSLPRLDRVIAPPESELAEILASKGLRDRFEEQLPTCWKTLDRLSNPQLKRLWEVIRLSGKALPQERFLISG